MEEYEQLLLQHRQSLERYVKFRLNGHPDAEDLLQDVCLAGFLKFHQLNNQEAFKGWILAIARNAIRDYYRREMKHPEISLDQIPQIRLCYGHRGLQRISPVEETLSRLGDWEQQILQLYYWRGLSQEQIGKILQIPLGTVKSRLSIARNRFRDQYPCPPKGDQIMTKLPKMMPQYTIEAVEAPPFAIRWEELQGWLIVPRLGEKLSWAMYDFPERTRTSWTRLEVIGEAEVHGIRGVEITATQYGEGDERDPGFRDSMERRFVAQLTQTHSRYLAESHVEDGIRKCYTFLDGEEFLNNWGYGEDNCGTEIQQAAKGLITRKGSQVFGDENQDIMDLVGRYYVTIRGKTYDTVCLMDIEAFNDAVAVEQYLDKNGRTILWRRFNRDDWALDRFGGKLWSEKLPDNERITINGQVYVHWYDCISDYIL